MKKIPITYKPNYRRVLSALTKASILSTLRHPSVLFFSFFFPFIFILIFGLLGEGSSVFNLGVSAGSLREGAFYEALSQVSVLNLVTDKTDEQFAEQLNKGQIPAVITISEEKVTIPMEGETNRYNVNLKVSAADPNNAKTVATIVDNIVTEFNDSNPSTFKYVNFTQTTVEGRKFAQIDFILPGQLAFALLTNALYGIAFSLLMMKRQLIIKRIFAAPVNKFVILLSEAFARVAIAILQALVIVLAGHFLFDFTLAHGVTTLLSIMVLSLVGIFTFIAFGLLVFVLSKNEEAVAPIANLIMMPQLFLSGAFFSIDAFPAFLQPIARLLPMTFLNEAFKKVAFEGAPLIDTVPQMLALLVWAALVYLIVVKLFKWE